MTETRLRLLIVGGYGVFGGRLAELLADEARLLVLIAGRSMSSAETFCDGFAAKAKLVPVVFDRTGDVLGQLRALGPDILVDASGPFQSYGAAPYKLVEAALDLGIPYLDLADGSAFVAGISQFDKAARERGVFLLSGVSSFPVLTAAVCRRLAQGLVRVDAIRGGIAPSPYAGVGRNVIEAISSYAGKPVGLTRGGLPASGFGLTETMRFTIAPPGALPLERKLFSLVDVPDLKVLPDQWPGLKSIWMGAGPVPEILHRMLILLAWLVRLGLLRSLVFLAPVFHKAINVVRWGAHRGGMFVTVEGQAGDGARVARSWHMVAEAADGPLIPSMAVEAIVRKYLDGYRPPAGARPATDDLELVDYEELFRRRSIVSGVREVREGMGREPLYRRVLGSAWSDLPQVIQAMHGLNGEKIAEGRADVDRGTGVISRVVGWLFGFPKAGRDIPVSVRFVEAGDGERWERSFDGRSFVSVQEQGRGRSEGLLTERFGPFVFGLALVKDGGRLVLMVRRWSFLGLPLPIWLAPRGESYEHVSEGRFCFNVDIRLPMAGQVVSYRGWLVPQVRTDGAK